MARFPMEYAVEVRKTEGAAMEVTAGNRPHLVVGAPAELGGSDVWWSPEHLLVSAAASCMAATFSALAERAKLSIGALRCRAHGRLDRVEARVAFSSMHLTLEVTVLADDVERASAVAADAKTHCFVAASLRCPVELVVAVKAS